VLIRRQPGGNLIFDTSGALTPIGKAHSCPTWTLSNGAASHLVAGDHGFYRHHPVRQHIDRQPPDPGTDTPAVIWCRHWCWQRRHLQGRYSNGQTRNMGQVVLATFRRPERPAESRQQSVESDLGCPVRNCSARRELEVVV
jgi:hypothetical protein